MSNDGSRTRRSSIRRPGHDYSAPGWYFVTICTRDRGPVLGEVVAGRPVLSYAGQVVDRCLRELPMHFDHVSVDAEVIMPDHVHAIIAIASRRPASADVDAGDACVAPTAASSDIPATHASPGPNPPTPGRGEACLARMTGRPAYAGPVEESVHVVSGDACVAPTAGPAAGSLSTIVGSFKAAVSRQINADAGTPAATIWERGFHDHIIRTPAGLERARRYIEDNPARWEGRRRAAA